MSVTASKNQTGVLPKTTEEMRKLLDDAYERGRQDGYDEGRE